MTVFIRYQIIKFDKIRKLSWNRNYLSTIKWNVIFFGSDNFSLGSLKRIFQEYISESSIKQLEVVTNINNRPNEVFKFASQNNLKIHSWPLSVLPENNFHLGIVVSFGHMIPQKIIQFFPLGILNVHASLLPRWRGAAPIIHTLMNGDAKTGVTVMKIHPKHFDVGEIVLQKEVALNNSILQPQLHNMLADLGGDSLVECLHTLPDCLQNAIPQKEELASYAPKISKSLSIINWQKSSANQIYNLSRALYGVLPLVTKYRDQTVKLFKVHLWTKDMEETSEDSQQYLPGYFIFVKKKSAIKVFCCDGQSIYFDTILIKGKKPMTALDFRNGFMKHVPKNQLYFTSDNL